jgi:hypothetical protein
MSLPISAASTERPAVLNPWVLASQALTVFYGCPEMPTLSHYFLPRLLFAKKQILYLDGANQISPLLLARFARGFSKPSLHWKSALATNLWLALLDIEKQTGALASVDMRFRRPG